MIGRWSTFNNVMLPITISIFIQHTIFIIVDLVSCFSKVYVTWSVMHITGWAWPLVTPTKTTVQILKKNTVTFTCITDYIVWAQLKIMFEESGKIYFWKTLDILSDNLTTSKYLLWTFDIDVCLSIDMIYEYGCLQWLLFFVFVA